MVYRTDLVFADVGEFIIDKPHTPLSQGHPGWSIKSQAKRKINNIRFEARHVEKIAQNNLKGWQWLKVIILDLSASATAFFNKIKT